MEVCGHMWEETVSEQRYFRHEQTGSILHCTRCGAVLASSMWGDEVLMLDDEEDQTRL